MHAQYRHQGTAYSYPMGARTHLRALVAVGAIYLAALVRWAVVALTESVS